MKYTKNYNLNLPDSTDFVDVSVLNANFSVLDEKVKNNQSSAENSVRYWDILLKSSGWSSTAPYTQTVSVSGLPADALPMLGYYLDDSAKTSASVNQISAQIAYIGEIDTSTAGKVTFKCYNQKPTIDLPISLKGV